VKETASTPTLYSQYGAEIDQILAKYPPGFKRSAVMPLLYLAQRQRGYVSREAMAEIAEITGVSTTQVGEVAGFYSLYYEEPHGKYHIQVCNDLPCAMRGADEFLQQVCDYLGISAGETTLDGLFTVEAVKCLAACHRAPMFQVQGDGDIIYHEQADGADATNTTQDIANRSARTLTAAKAWIEEVRASSAAFVGAHRDTPTPDHGGGQP
jgi:NADH-quinone oxidoreductase subunit E